MRYRAMQVPSERRIRTLCEGLCPQADFRITVPRTRRPLGHAFVTLAMLFAIGSPAEGPVGSAHGNDELREHVHPDRRRLPRRRG
ncbi:hypothetical protein PSCLAVI8L_60190 [Pseudoclavibacter sp. 8L]|nr:hypothetical protein PSCLAVI8L_60190 [Pseudoclavibacter sp. 8L]